jgi:type I restriction-modification system DNA methylase subunit
MIPNPPPPSQGETDASKRARSRRKEQGIVYTPDTIVRYIFGQCLVLADPFPPNTTEGLSVSARVEQRYGFYQGLRIFDPACGDGAFLSQAIFALSVLNVISMGSERRRTPQWAILERIATTNIFGFDTDEQAVLRCRARVLNWVETAGTSTSKEEKREKHEVPPQSVKLIEEHIRVANALSESPPQQFDIVLGNPPYVTMTSIPAGWKDQYARQFATYHANGDLYYLFLERAFTFLKPGGILGMVVPRYFLKAPTAERLRTFLATKRCWFIDDLGQVPSFPGVGTHVILLFFENRPAQPGEFATLRIHRYEKSIQKQDLEQDIPRQVKFAADQLGPAPWAFQSQKYVRFFTRVRSKAAGYLPDFCTLAKGVQTGKDAVFVVDEAMVAAWHLEGATLRRWVKGRDLVPFRILSATPKYVIFSTIHEGDAIQSFPNTFAYLQEHEAELQERSRVAAWYQWRKGDERVTLDWASPKIVGRYKGHHPVFALDTSGAYFSQDVVLVQPKPGQAQYQNFFLALLNSPVVERIAQNEFKELAYHVYEWYPQQLAKIPVILPPPAVLAEINGLISEIPEYPTQETPKTKLNDLITTLYGHDQNGTD